MLWPLSAASQFVLLLWLLVLTPPLFIPCQQACEIMSAFRQALSLKAAR